MQRVEAYIDKICRDIDGDGQEIQDLKEEMKYHLMSSIKELIMEGKSTDESIETALARFDEDHAFEAEMVSEFQNSKRIKLNLNESQSLRKVDVKMYIMGVVFFLLAMGMVITLSGTQVAAFLSATSLLVILVSLIAVIIATKSSGDFKNGLKVVLTKQHQIPIVELYKSIKIYELLIKTSVGSGVLGFFIGIVAMFGNITAVDQIGPYATTALVSLVYGIVFAYFIFMPIKFRLENERG